MTRVVVLLKNGEGKRFEAYCEAKGHKKSPLIVRLIREHLDKEGFATQRGLFDPSDPPKQKQAKGARSRRRDGESRP